MRLPYPLKSIPVLAVFADQKGIPFGIVSKPVNKPIDKLTTFQATRGASIRRKRHNYRHLDLLNGVEQSVKVVNRDWAP